jgi:DNA-binding CsgD family transcriptional regulator
VELPPHQNRYARFRRGTRSILNASSAPNNLPHPHPGPVKKTILAYGILGGVLIAILRLVEYRYLVLEHSLELYGGIIAAIFSGLGIWLGLKLTRTRETVVVREVAVPVSGPFERSTVRLQQLGITPRELEILEAMAAGFSNREIAARLFVSENTVKTHAARVFDKLSARRRTQAVQLAKEAGLIP